MGTVARAGMTPDKETNGSAAPHSSQTSGYAVRESKMMNLNPPPPVLVTDLLPEERDALLGLLATFDSVDWQTATICPGWTVHDLGLHLLGNDLGRLARDRDGYGASLIEKTTWPALVEALNTANEQWVEATRMLSPALLVELLDWTGARTLELFRTLDPDAVGVTVSWASTEPVANWLDAAREYTERWVHQQQIRAAVRAPGLTEQRFLDPVIETFMRSLPKAYQAIDAEEGTAVTIVVPGTARREWTVQRKHGEWKLYEGRALNAAAVVQVDANTAWRYLSRNMGRAEAEALIDITGNARLGQAFLNAVAVIVD